MTPLFCLAMAIYFEARGEPLEGQYLVGATILNRTEDKSFPPDVCQVVFQEDAFSFVKNPQEATFEPNSFARSEEIAVDLLTGLERDHRILFFTTDPPPRWARYLQPIRKVGRHVFMGWRE